MSDKKFKVLIVEKSEVFLKKIIAMINAIDSMEIIGIAKDSSEASKMFYELKPKCVVVNKENRGDFMEFIEELENKRSIVIVDIGRLKELLV